MFTSGGNDQGGGGRCFDGQRSGARKRGAWAGPVAARSGTNASTTGVPRVTIWRERYLLSYEPRYRGAVRDDTTAVVLDTAVVWRTGLANFARLSCSGSIE